MKFPSYPSEKIKERATSLQSWRLPKQESSLAPEGVWTNADQDPVSENRRTWTKYTFLAYWFSDLWTVQGWEAMSSMLVVGLSATDAIALTIVAGFCNSLPTVLNGALGADLHVGFPVAARSSFGYWFSYFAVFSRAVLALFWFGINGYAGAYPVATMITAIWPSFANIANHLPENAGVTTQLMICYLIYSVIQIPFLFVPTERLQLVFLAKACLVPPMVLSMVIWTIVKSGGSGTELFHIKASVHGSAHTWLFLKTLTSIIGAWATLPVNIADFSRFSKDRQAQWWQLPVIPVLKICGAICGLAATGATKRIYGEYVWNPLTIVSSWCDTSAGRFAAFVAAFIWLLAQICCNVSANAVSFSNDITTLWPKWFNMRRGVVFAIVFGGWALIPWKILASATNFLSFMSGYTIFMGPFTGLLVCDYWIVKRRRVDVPALYNPNGRYRYNKYGTNPRALAILLVIIPPLLPGLAYSVSSSDVHVDAGIQHLYYINWFYGFCGSIILYWALNVIWPARETLVAETIPAFRIVDGVEAPHRGDIEEFPVEKLETVTEITSDRLSA